MHSFASSTSVRVSIVACLLLAGCPPTTASCPAGFVLASDGRCVAGTDAGPTADGSVGDTGVPVMVDAGVGPDGCALHAFYADTDGDGFGDSAATMFACEMPTGYAATSNDCNDSCATCHPGATEVCEGSLDENCNGTVDEGTLCSCPNGATQPCGMSSTAPCHMGTQTCAAGAWGACSGNVDPIAETCNGVDDDCDGTADDGLTIPVWYVDADGDAHGAPGATTMAACTMPAGYAASSDDCNDASAAVYSGATEVCDGLDNDCSGAADNTFACVQGVATSCTTSCGSMGTGLCTTMTCTSPTGAACTPPAETCNGMDESCDGAADDGLALVGNARTAVSGTGLRSPHIVPFGTGYMVFYTSNASGRVIRMQQLDASGTPVGASVSLGTGVAPTQAWGFSARASGSHVLVGWIDGTSYKTMVVNSGGTGTSAPFVLPTPASTLMGYRLIAADFSDTTMHATVYAMYRPTTTTYSIRRFRLNFAGTAPVVPTILDARDMSTGLTLTDPGVQWDALSTTSADYLALVNSSGQMALMTTPNGDASANAALVGTLPFVGSAPAGIAMGIENAAAPVSATNPIGVAWQFRGLVGTGFVQVTGGTSGTFATGAAITLMGSTGSPDNLIYPDWIEVVAVPNSSSFAHTGHWLVASAERDGASSNVTDGWVRAWEVTGGSAPTGRALTLPSDEVSATRLDISIASVGTSLRLAEENATGAIVTRQLGCR